MIHIKKILCLLILLTQAINGANPIHGFWKTVNEEGVAQALIAIYEYKELFYGRIIASFDSSGKIKDSIYHPIERAPGVIGDPFYSGLDIIWNLEDGGWVYKGRILDPENGKVYKAEIWNENGDLIVRCKLLMFGRNQTWLAVTPNDFPGFKFPDTQTFVPVIPMTK